MRRVAMASVIALLTACGGGTTPPTDTGTVHDSGTSDTSAVDTGTSVDTGVMDTGTTDTGGTMDVASSHDVVLMNTPNSVYCYTAGTCTGGPTSACCSYGNRDAGYGEMCVDTTSATDGGACPMGGKIYECDKASDCASGDICCAVVGVSSHGTAYIDSSTCTAASACPSGQTELCITSADCATGTCNPVDASGRYLGECM